MDSNDITEVAERISKEVWTAIDKLSETSQNTITVREIIILKSAVRERASSELIRLYHSERAPSDAK